MLNLKTNLIVLALFFLSVLSLSAQWQSVDFPEEKGTIIHFDLIDANTAYAVFFNSINDLTLEKTVDGGLTWSQVDSPIASIPYGFQGVHFFDEGKGVMLIRDLSDDVQPTKLYRTFDDGLSWNAIGPEETATGIGDGATQFLSEEIGFFSTDTYLYRTLNGGQSWTVHLIPGYIQYLDFVDENTGVVGLFDGSFLYRGGMYCTTDGGETWNGQYLDTDNSLMDNIVQASNNKAYATANRSNSFLSNHSTIFVSEDAGLSWDSIPTPIDVTNIEHAYIDIDNEDELHALFYSDNSFSLYYRNELTETWEFEYSFASLSALEMAFSDDAVFLSGKKGQFWKKIILSSTRTSATNTVELYPNPLQSGGLLNLDGLEGSYDLQLLDSKGQVVLFQRYFDQEALNIPLLPSGLYMLRLITATSEMVKPLIIK